MTLIELIETLQFPLRRFRTGIWLAPDNMIGKEAVFITCLPIHCDCMDLQQIALRNRPKGVISAGITPEHVIHWMKESLECDGICNTVIFIHFDLLLSKLLSVERSFLVKTIYDLPHINRSLIIEIPVQAVGTLIDDKELFAWQSNLRLADQ